MHQPFMFFMFTGQVRFISADKKYEVKMAQHDEWALSLVNSPLFGLSKSIP